MFPPPHRPPFRRGAPNAPHPVISGESQTCTNKTPVSVQLRTRYPGSVAAEQQPLRSTELPQCCWTWPFSKHRKHWRGRLSISSTVIRPFNLDGPGCRQLVGRSQAALGPYCVHASGRKLWVLYPHVLGQRATLFRDRRYHLGRQRAVKAPESELRPSHRAGKSNSLAPGEYPTEFDIEGIRPLGGCWTFLSSRPGSSTIIAPVAASRMQRDSIPRFGRSISLRALVRVSLYSPSARVIAVVRGVLLLGALEGLPWPLGFRCCCPFHPLPPRFS